MCLPSEVNFVKNVGDFIQHNGNKIAPKKSGTVFVLSHNWWYKAFSLEILPLFGSNVPYDDDGQYVPTVTTIR